MPVLQDNNNKLLKNKMPYNVLKKNANLYV